MTVILGVPGGAVIDPPDTVVAEPYAPPVPSFGNMMLSSSRGEVFLQGTVEALVGWQGLGPAKRKPNTSVPLGIDGSIINRRRPTTRSERRMTGPVHVQAPTAQERAAEARKLLAVLSPFDQGPVTFTASIETGELVTGECWAQFAGGDEWATRAAYDTAAVLELDLVFPDYRLFGEPRRAGQSQVVSAPFFPIGPVKLTDSTSFGTPLTVPVGGELPVHAVWYWTGPGSKLTVTGAGGEVWEIDLTSDPLLAGEVVVVTTDPRAASEGVRRVVGPQGQPYWSKLTRHTFFPLAAGEDTVTIDVVGTGAGSAVYLAWRPAIEAIL